jgi:WD40 repeat protein
VSFPLILAWVAGAVREYQGRREFTVQAASLESQSYNFEAMTYATAGLGTPGALAPFRGEQAETVALKAGLGLHLARNLGVTSDIYSGDQTGRNYEFSPNSQWLVTQGANKVGRVWNLRNSEMREIGPIIRVPRDDEFAATQDHDWVLTYTPEGMAVLWNLTSGARRELQRVGSPLDYNERPFSPDGKHVVTVDKDKAATLWTVSSASAGQDLGTLFFGQHAFSADGRWLIYTTVIASEKRVHVALWDLVTSEHQTIRDAYHTAISRNSEWVAIQPTRIDDTGQMDRADSRVLFNLRDYTQRKLAAGILRVIDFAPQGEGVFISRPKAPNDAETRDVERAALLNLRTNYEVDLGWVGGLNNPTFSSNGSHFVLEKRLWGFDKNGGAHLVDLGVSDLIELVFSQDGESVFAIGEQDKGHVYQGARSFVLNLKTGNRREFGPATQEGQYKQRLSLDGKWLLLNGDVWNVESGVLYEMKAHFLQQEFSPDSAWLLTADLESDRLKLTSLSDLNDVRDVGRFGRHVGSPYRSGFSPNGAWLVTQGLDGSALWDLSGGALTVGQGEQMLKEICNVSGRGIPPFSTSVRGRADFLGGQLRGRPWHPCDWRGLGAGLEGWAQWWRQILIQYFGAPDYKCEERTAGGATDSVSDERCARMREQQSLALKLN